MKLDKKEIAIIREQSQNLLNSANEFQMALICKIANDFRSKLREEIIPLVDSKKISPMDLGILIPSLCAIITASELFSLLDGMSIDFFKRIFNERLEIGLKLEKMKHDNPGIFDNH